MPDALPWSAARDAAGAEGARLRAGLPVERVPLAAAAGRALAADLVADADLPPAPTSAMDGWAVAGPGPWQVTGAVLAGQRPAPLPPGTAVVVATGTWLPPGAEAVLRREHGGVEGGTLRAAAPGAPAAGRDVRPRGEEVLRGTPLVPAGARATPAVVALAAAAGHDDLAVRAVPRLALLVVGDELLAAGPPRDGKVRDALGPALPAWFRALGAAPRTERVPDDPDALAAALARPADVVVTTGATAAGPADHLRPVLRRLGARLLVPSVDVRPGHPMLLARLPDGTPVVGLPGNPLAAAAGVLTLVAPLLGAGAGRRCALAAPLPAGRATRLVPVRDGAPCAHTGPGMLRGLAAADGVAVVPPGEGASEGPYEVLDLPR
ncbi:molybdopterin-binding protein [Vallicoccus soli]|uniref:Molybdopterin molybdenumtransferase n=1 Tax=Vallicoccus soli TaxID=2339232 RepID=A0A3A3YZV0_9ACTN|nr:molybdopterin-binding protein [Vallicoccus soli]RJK97499.1 molybdopterin molybdenumtransferase MoeA [Vallicoccus soli]